VAGSFLSCCTHPRLVKLVMAALGSHEGGFGGGGREVACTFLASVAVHIHACVAGPGRVFFVLDCSERKWASLVLLLLHLICASLLLEVLFQVTPDVYLDCVLSVDVLCTLASGGWIHTYTHTHIRSTPDGPIMTSHPALRCCALQSSHWAEQTS
jgi:hypothetical protein